jgi:hypothetical protein
MSEREQPTAAREAAGARNSSVVAAAPTTVGPAIDTLVGPAIDLPRFRSQSAPAGQSSVELYIEELVLHGFAPGDRYRIGDALERELTRLFNERELPAALTDGGEFAHLDGGRLRLAADSNPDEVGVLVARAVFGGFSQ